MRPTLKKIAEQANVSIGTVDRVLHNRGRVAADTRERVLKIARELSYRPNVFARHLVRDRLMTIAVVMPEVHYDGYYWQLPVRGIEQALKDLHHFDINVEYFFYDRDSEQSFLSAGEKALASPVDGLLLAPVLPEPSMRLVKNIPTDLPYIFFDSSLPESNALSVIHQHSIYGGRVSARLISLLSQNRGTSMIVRFLPTAFHIEQRIKGFIDYIKDCEGLHATVVDIPIHSNKAILAGVLSDAIRDNNDVTSVFVTGARTYEISSALREMPGVSGTGRCFVVGFDLIEDNIKELKAGAIDFLISQNPELQGYFGVETLYRFLMLNQEAEPEITLPIEIISKENVDFYLFNTFFKKNKGTEVLSHM